MTDGDALLAAILAAPEDDLPRLMYADCIEDTQPARAEFIRVQIAIANIHGDPDCPHPIDIGPDLERKRILRKRERELLDAHGYGWCDGFAGPNWKTHGRGKDADTVSVRYFSDRNFTEEIKLQFSRGFISKVTCSAADWLAHHAAIFWHPEQTEECPACKGLPAVRHGPLCKPGKERGTGRIARPFMPTAQPITRVVFPEPPGDIVPFGSLCWGDGRRFTSPKWPGVVFELPLFIQRMPMEWHEVPLRLERPDAVQLPDGTWDITHRFTVLPPT